VTKGIISKNMYSCVKPQRNALIQDRLEILDEKDNFFNFIIVLANTTNYFSKCLKYSHSYSIRILKSRRY